MDIYLKIIQENEKEDFKNKIQESFAVAIQENFKNPPLIPSDKDMEKTFNDFDNDIYFIYHNEEKIGGAVIKENKKTQRNSLELFFIFKDKHGFGLGLEAWKAIEKKYPQTKIWETITPYFEKRNINFYINKCGFHIVEFCNKYHQNKNIPIPENDLPGTEDFFVFEKVM